MSTGALRSRYLTTEPKDSSEKTSVLTVLRFVELVRLDAVDCSLKVVRDVEQTKGLGQGFAGFNSRRFWETSEGPDSLDQHSGEAVTSTVGQLLKTRRTVRCLLDGPRRNNLAAPMASCLLHRLKASAPGTAQHDALNKFFKRGSRNTRREDPQSASCQRLYGSGILAL